MPSPSSQSPFLQISRVLSFWGAAIAIMLGVGFLRGLVPPALGPLAWGLVSSLALFALISLFLRRDRRSLADVGLAWASTSPIRFLAGLGLGVATYATTLLVSSLVLGPIRLGPGAPPSVGAVVLIIMGLAALAVMEELAFRSYAFWTATQTVGLWPAQLLVAVAFSLLHVAYGWPISTVLLGVFPSAILFGMAALVSGGLAFPLGLHLGINLARWMTGQSDGAGFWALDTRGLDPTRAATLAPLLGAIVPVVMALGLFALYRRRTPLRTA